MSAETANNDYLGKLLLTDADGHLFSFVKWRNHLVTNSKDSPGHVEDFCRHFVPQSDDIWICAYPKCGTHWLHGVLHMLVSGSLDNLPGKEVGFVEYSKTADLHALRKPRILSTHLPLSVMTQKAVFQSRVIVVFREPKDVVTSFYYHTKSTHTLEYPFLGDFHAFLKLFLEGTMECGDYVEYVKDWWPFVHNADGMKAAAGGKSARVLILTYEDMKKNLKQEIGKIVSFLDLSETVSEAYLQQVTEAADFANMQKMFDADNKTGMYRKGIVGDWVNHFTEKERAHFDDHMRTHLGGLGIPYY